jgi:hypothetical protein
VNHQSHINQTIYSILGNYLLEVTRTVSHPIPTTTSMPASSDDEPFGTTPIPTSWGSPLTVTLDLSPSTSEVAQQPQTQQIAVYEATPNEECINGSLLDVNQHFVVYAVKNGLIRVLHRHSAMRALLRGHQGQTVTDVSFFLDGDVLGTVGSSTENGSSTLIIWRVFEQSPEIKSEKLLELPSSAVTQGKLSRLLWHPFNPNQFWMVHAISTGQQIATLVETTRIQTTMHPDPEESHPVCHWHAPDCVMDGAVQLASSTSSENSSLTDLAWSGRDTRHVLTTHDNGQIILWDLKQTQLVNGTVTTPRRLAVLQEDGPVSRCLFLPHENAVGKEHQTETLTTCFVTATHQNSIITLWSSFIPNDDGGGGEDDPLGNGNNSTQLVLPSKLQVLRVANPSPSYNLEMCFGPAPQDASPPSSFLLWSDRHDGQLLAVHVASQWNAQQKAVCVGCDYVVPFVLKHPVYSWSVVCCPTQDISEEDILEHQGLIFDMKLFSYQSKVVQCLTLTSYMCLPPEHGYVDGTPGVKVELLEGSAGGAGGTSVGLAISEVDTAEYDEEYDVEDDPEEEVEAPEPSALPTPDDAATSSSGTANPFANWLGAIATNTTKASPPTDRPHLPPPPPSTPSDGIKSAKTVPLPPGLGVPAAPGMHDAARSVSASTSISSQQPLLSPMDLMLTGGGGAGGEKANNNTNTNSTHKGGRSTTPNKMTKGNTKQKKSRSKSPKGKKNKNQMAAHASPFPDGAKISILKRDDKSPPAPTTTRDPVVVPSDHSAIVDPAVIRMAAFPDPNLEVTLSRVVSQELAKQDVNQAVEQALTAKLVPAVNKVVQESLASFGRPLQASMDKLGQQGVRVDAKDLQAALDLEIPIKAALADAMRNVFIPAMESMTAQVLQQATPPPPKPDESKATLEALTQQLMVMNSKMDAMSQELKALKGAANRPPPVPVPQQQQPPPPLAPPKMDIRPEINMLLQRQKYEAAFTKALSASTADMALYCCSRADLGAVLGGNSPTLSQPILLCLMQQLGAALVGSSTLSPEILQMDLQWLQEIALTLNPADPNIQRHVPTVLQQLVASINQKMAEGNPHLRRPLQMLLQVIRGMQMG